MNKSDKNITPYPVGLLLRGKNCLVVGGGNVAWRKVNTLLEHGALVTVVSPELCHELGKSAASDKIGYIPRQYKQDDLASIQLVIAATNDGFVNRQVSFDARREKVPVNVVDNELLSDFILPAYFTRGNLLITVSTSGKSPALARKLRDKFYHQIGIEYEELVVIVNRVRTRVQECKLNLNPECWQEALDIDQLIEFVRRGLKEEAEEWLFAKLSSFHRKVN